MAENTKLAVASLVVSLLALALVAVAATGGAAAETPDEPAFQFELADDGSADVTLVMTFDLSDDDRAAAFEELRDNEADRESLRETYADRMSAVAADASNETDREMDVRDPGIDLRTVDDTGIVELSVTWDGLAAVENGELTVTEPFASGFEPDRPVHLVAPDGYEFVSVTPDADETADDRLTWAAGSDLSDFEAVASETTDDGTDEVDDDADETDADDTDAADADTDDDPEPADDDGPGFGVLAALTALLAAALLAARRR